MLLQLISIRDSAIDAYDAPRAVVSVGGAVRSFGDEVNRADEKNPMYKHPDDYELYHLGSYDDAAAEFDLFDKPRLVARAKDLKK